MHTRPPARDDSGLLLGNPGAQALLSDAGYNAVRSFCRMARRLEAPLPRPAVPEGYLLRPLDADADADADALYELDRSSFAGNPDYVAESPEEFRRAHLEGHNLEPRLSLLAEAAGRPAGFLLARRREPERVGYVELLGVAPAHRGRALATAMLETAFSAFAAAGLTEAQLGVASDNPGARRLYERLGMRPQSGIQSYERPIPRDDFLTSETS